MEVLQKILNNYTFKFLIIMIIFDTIFGILRAFKQKKINSTIGINGLIRKSGMLISMLFLLIIDKLMNLNLIAFIPKELRTFTGITEVTISNIFAILFILFEAISIMKNMIICELPIPHKFQKKLEELMYKFTNEI